MMKGNGSLVELLKPVGGLAPVIVQTAGVDTDTVSMKGCAHLTAIFMCGDLGSSTYLRITPYQGASLGTCATALAPDFYWLSGATKAAATTADTWTKTAWGSNAYIDIDTTDYNVIIEVRAQDLTAGNVSVKFNLDSSHNTGPTASVFFFGTMTRFSPSESMVA